MDEEVFSGAIAAEILSALAVGISIVFPRWRIWPPPHRSPRTGYLTWLLFGISAAGVVVLGIIDWGGLNLPLWIRWAIGVPLLVPFAEEPWLAERYGTAYEEYRQAVPRFIYQRGHRG